MCPSRKIHIIQDGIYVRGASFEVKMLFLEISSSLCYNNSLPISLFQYFSIPSYGGFPPLYSSLQAISIVHLFIIQPRTQVSVLLSSFSSFLWAVAVENTVQRSSPHSCGQESCCNAFNAVVAAFSQDIFVVLSLPYAPEVYLRCWNLLEDYPSQAKAYLTDIRQVRRG